MNRKIDFGTVFIVLFIVAAGIIFCRDGKQSSDEANDFQALADDTADESITDVESTEDTKIYVYVCGQVKSPGVYALPTGSRIFEAVEAAGGAGEKAGLERLNMASVLSDGQKVYVPAEGEEWSETDSNVDGQDRVSDVRVNINTASVQELLALPGIGEVRAKAIVAYRTANGPFDSIEALKQVTGIGDSVYEQVQALIRAD